MLVALLAVALPSSTAYVFVRFFSGNDLSQRPITNPPADQLDWVDQRAGSDAKRSRG